MYDEIQQKFPLLKNIHMSTMTAEQLANAIIIAGYDCILWPEIGKNLSDFKKFVSAVYWCKEKFPDTSYCASNMFLFSNKNEATLFKLIWL